MVTNLVDNTELENKNLSPELEKLIQEANNHSRNAEQKILEAYKHAVVVDKLKPKQAAKILYNNLSYTPQWIRNFLPQEAKQTQIHNRGENKKVKALSPFSKTKPLNNKNIVIPSTKPIIKDAEIVQEEKAQIIESFWVKYHLEIGPVKRTLELLINPFEKKIMDSKIYR